nr:MAG TPA: DNA POLYMERASE [Caudoviricetes sp.]
MLEKIDLNKPVCLDIETTGLHRFTDDITSLQLGYTNIITGKYERKFFDWAKTDMKFLLKLLTYLKKAKLVTHNGKFDLLFIYVKTGIELNLWVDTLVLAHVCGEEELGLKPLVKKYFNVDYDIATEAKKGKITDAFISYGLDDVLYPVKLMKIFKKKLNMYDLVKVYKHEMRAYRAYYEVEKNGVPISPRRGEIAKKLIEEYMPIYERLITVADINWNSTAQVSSVLFGKKNKPIYKEKGEKLPNTYEVIEYLFTGEQIVRGEFDTRKEATQFKEEYLAENNYLYGIDVKLKHNFKPVIIGYGVGLKVIEKTAKGVPSVSSDVLMNYVGNPVVDDLLEYRRLTKLETFIKSWDKIQVNDKIYPSFNITARTGRTTCSNPNLQQIPQDKNVRNLIEARPGHKIIECFSGDTEVLTEKGWQRLDLLDKTLKVAQYDTDSRDISFAKPLEYIHNESRETFYYEDRHTSLCATANHNMLTTWGKNFDIVKYKFKDVRFSRGNAFINAGFYNNGASNEFQSRYIAMFTADGSQSEKGYVTFCFSKERKVERCKYILDTLGVEYSLSKIIRLDGAVNYNFYVGKRTNHLLRGFVDRDKKLTMNCIHSLDIKAFLDEVQYWDATYTVAKGKQTVRFVTCVKETAEIVQLMCNLQGKKSTIRIDDHNSRVTDGRHSVMYYLSYKRHRDDPHTFMNGEIVDFTQPVIQDVYCVTMPMGTVMIRHRGKVSIQGNCDFSQIELRVASMFSGDENMQHAYQSGSDLHSKTTELLFGDTSHLSPQEQKRKRTEAKSMNFGFLYGMSAKTFVDYAKGYGLNITEEQSESFRNNFFEAYPRLLPWHEECKDYARKNGHTWSPIGRKRFLPDINSSNWSDRGSAERQSINSGVQGFASDMCISALSDIVFSDIIDHERCKVLGSVHDAILFEVKDDYVDEVVPMIKEMMEHPSIIEGIDIPIPIIADVEIAQAWGG